LAGARRPPCRASLTREAPPMLENPRRKRPIACSRASMRSVPASRGRHKLLSARCTNLFSSRKSQRWSHPAPTGPLHTTNGDRLTAYPSKGVNTTVCTNIYFIRLGPTRGSMGFNSSLLHEVASVVLRCTPSWIRKVHFHLTLCEWSHV
jgi:hypothetical protein